MQYSTLYHLFKETKAVCTDSRKITEGCLFIALKGPSFNGNDFILDCINGGAAYAIADEDRPEFKGHPQVILVEDGLKALQHLALEHRSHLKIPIIGLTGSNGKTTSKELLKAALSQTYHTYATRGNLNNHIGVPISVLEINESHEIAIIEMGANHQKEITFLTTICRPDLGFITNIGLAHLEGFGGEEGVYIGKKELFDHLVSNGAKLFINADDPKVVKAAQGHEGTLYGRGTDCHFQGEDEIVDHKLTVHWWRDIDQFKRTIHTQLTGAYNFSNVLAAVAIARYFGVPDEKIKRGIESYRPSNNRSQVESTARENKVIVDCYNANPSSMTAAIENLHREPGEQKLAIVADMLELGEVAVTKHQETVSLLRDLRIQAILVGELFGQTEHMGFPHFHSTEALMQHLQKEPITSTTVLLKGSRKMKLEDLLELL